MQDVFVKSVCTGLRVCSASYGMYLLANLLLYNCEGAEMDDATTMVRE